MVLALLRESNKRRTAELKGRGAKLTRWNNKLNCPTGLAYPITFARKAWDPFFLRCTHTGTRITIQQLPPAWLIRAASALGLGSPLPHLHRDRSHLLRARVPRVRSVRLCRNRSGSLSAMRSWGPSLICYRCTSHFTCTFGCSCNAAVPFRICRLKTTGALPAVQCPTGMQHTIIVCFAALGATCILHLAMGADHASSDTDLEDLSEGRRGYDVRRLGW